MKQLHPGAKWFFRINGYWAFLFLALIFGWMIVPIFLAIFKANLGTAFITIISVFLLYILAVIILGEVYARMAYNRWFYEFTPNQLRLERGIIWKRYSNVAYERIQNVDITRGIIARIIGFSTVNIQTAGYSAPAGKSFAAHAEGYIPAVSKQEAEQIREFVIKKISASKGKQGL